MTSYMCILAIFSLYISLYAAEACGEDGHKRMDDFLLMKNLAYLSKTQGEKDTVVLSKGGESESPIGGEAELQDHFFDIDAVDMEEKLKRFDFHGAVSQVVIADGRDDDTQVDTKKFFDQTDITLWLRANIVKSLSFTAEIELENGFKLDLERAHLDWSILGDRLTVRGGKFPFPFGIERHYYHPVSNELIDRPSPFVRILPGLYTDVGIEFFGKMELPVLEALKYEFAITNGLDSFGDTGKQEDFTDNNTNKQLGGRLGLVLLPGLEIGGSYLTGKYDMDASKRLYLAGADVSYKIGGFGVRGEYIAGTVGLEGGGDFYRYGYYLQTSYRHDFELDYLKYLEGVVRFDSVTARDDMRTNKDADRIAFGIDYSPLKSLVLKFEYEINNQKVGGENNVLFQAVWHW